LRSVVWTSGDSKIHKLNIEEGADVSFNVILAFVKKNTSIKKKKPTFKIYLSLSKL